MFIALLLNKEYSLKGSIIGTLFCFVFFYYWAYSAANKYYALEKNGDYLNLSYISPAKNKSISIRNIEYISFGSTNRSGKGCYISITLFNGNKYKSSAIQEKINYCKVKRNELISRLNIKANNTPRGGQPVLKLTFHRIF